MTASRFKLGGQVAAVALVAALLALLVWKVARGSGQTATPANFTLSRLDQPGTLSLASLRGKIGHIRRFNRGAADRLERYLARIVPGSARPA